MDEPEFDAVCVMPFAHLWNSELVGEFPSQMFVFSSPSNMVAIGRGGDKGSFVMMVPESRNPVYCL